MKHIIIKVLFFVLISCKGICQSTNWTTITDKETGISFSSPDNTDSYDTDELKLFAAEISSSEAVQVHICKDAEFNVSDSVYQEALAQENNDSLRAMARMILLTSNSELTSIEEITTNGERGIELGIIYTDLQSEIQYYSFIRYYIIAGDFVSFTWTGDKTTAGLVAKGTVTNKSNFFQSINIE